MFPFWTARARRAGRGVYSVMIVDSAKIFDFAIALGMKAWNEMLMAIPPG